MDITWYGHSCFRVVERGHATIVTDPFDESLGYEIPRLKADVVTISHVQLSDDAAVRMLHFLDVRLDDNETMGNHGASKLGAPGPAGDPDNKYPGQEQPGP